MARVTSCCCGCSLRDGTIILLVLNIMISFLGLVFSLENLKLLLLNAGTLAMAGAGLYGVFQQKPYFIIPHMACQIFSFVTIVICMVVLLVGGFGMISSILEIHENVTGSKKSVFASDSFSVLLLIEFVIGLCAGLQYYFFVVVYSLFMKLKGSTSPYSP